MSDLRARAEEGAKLLRTLDAVATAAATAGAPVQSEQAPSALRDVSDSGVPAAMDVPVHVAWSRVMQDCAWLGKDRQADKYKYRGIDDVVNLVGPALRKHGVFVMPTGIEPTFTVINTKSGAAMNYARVTCHFTIYGPRGDTMPASVLGEGFDNGDKSGSKAQSVALRTLYLNALAIQTSEPARDTEYGNQYEIAGPKAPTAGEYHAEIIDERTSVPRLQQIRDELERHPVLNHATVEGLDGEQIELGRLVRRVGAARLKSKTES